MLYVGVMELADVTDSKSVDSDIVWVRPPSPAPKRTVLVKRGRFFFSRGGRTKPDDGVNKTVQWTVFSRRDLRE